MMRPALRKVTRALPLLLLLIAGLVSCGRATDAPPTGIVTVATKPASFWEDCSSALWYNNSDNPLTCWLSYTFEGGGSIFAAISQIGANLSTSDDAYAACNSIKQTMLSRYYAGRVGTWNGFNSVGWNGWTTFGPNGRSAVQPPYLGDTGLWAHEGFHAWAQSYDEASATYYQTACS
jgi:hypothetical protein